MQKRLVRLLLLFSLLTVCLQAGEPALQGQTAVFTISVQVHKVFADNYHASLRLIPENQKKYEHDKRFANILKIDGKCYRYATIGAGPGGFLGRKLVSGINRWKDLRQDIKVEYALVDLKGALQDEIIEKLLENREHYRDNLDYDIFPAATEEQQVWYRPDDSYNSNSFISGLLQSLKLDAPQLNHNTPGYDKPLPAKFFR